MAADLNKIADKLVAGAINDVAELTQQALDAGSTTDAIMQQGLMAGMSVVGERFKNAEMFVPEVLRSAKAMSAGMEILRPHLSATEVKSSRKLVIGTVQGDLHEIGQKLVGMLFEGAGFQVINVGVDVKPEQFVAAVNEHKPDLVGMSSLLTTTMPKMAETITALKEAGVRDQIKVMVGGAPVTAEFAEEIGADGYASNAVAAVDQGKALLA
jgi:5-methyltetrahydrofolate--homocysteine methyltransferase